MYISRLKFLFCLLLLYLIFLPGVQALEQKVNQKKIGKGRERKLKQEKMDYQNAVKRHKKMQSKETKSMMRQSKKESRSLTPVKL